MRTVENRYPNSPLSGEEIHTPPALSLQNNEQGEHNFSLLDTFGKVESSEQETIAMKIIDRMKFGPNNSSVLYFYHLWQENPGTALIRIKKLVSDIREDELERIQRRVIDDDQLTGAYDEFYNKYTRATEKFRKKGFALAIEEGISVSEAAGKTELDLSSAVVVKPQLETRPKDITLEESLAGKKLFLEEIRIVQAIDILKIPPKDKKILFATKLFFGDRGVLRGMELGFHPNTVVKARDDLVTTDKYEEPWRKLEYLLKPNVIEILIQRKAGVSYRQIAQLLEIPKSRVERIISDLIAGEFIEISPKGKAAAQKAKKRAKELVQLRGGYNSPQIAERLGVSEDSVRAVWKREVRRGKINSLDKKTVVEINPQYEFYRILRARIAELRAVGGHRYTEGEIADILSQEMEKVITVQQVKRQIRILLQKGNITRRINQVK